MKCESCRVKEEIKKGFKVIYDPCECCGKANIPFKLIGDPEFILAKGEKAQKLVGKNK